MAWPDEKEALLATIRSHEQKATALAKRFELLQQTLQEQQKVLDRYQRALKAAQREAQINKRRGSGELKKSSTACANSTELNPPVDLSWIKKKTTISSNLETEREILKQDQVKKQALEARETITSAKSAGKRASDKLATTWAEEKQRMFKKSKWEQTLKASSTNKVEAVPQQSPIKAKEFAYVEVVRNREERKTLLALDCVECKKYYDALGNISAVDATAHKNKCSRHRARFEPCQTPDDFWRLSFPDSAPELKFSSRF